MWRKVVKVAKTLFYILAFIGVTDIFYQAYTHTECGGPIATILGAAFPNSPGAVKCKCEAEKPPTAKNEKE